MSTSNNQKRLKILTPQEVQDLFDRPCFDDDERKIYFSLDEVELKAAKAFRALDAQISFVIDFGYFKAKRSFFDYDYQDVLADCHYIADKYFHRPHKTWHSPKKVSPMARSRLRARILKLLGSRPYDTSVARELTDRGGDLVKLCAKPEFIFKSLFTHLESTQTEVPCYGSLQDLIGSIIVEERLRLENRINKHVPQTIKSSLVRLLEPNSSLYELTKLKKDPKSFGHSHVHAEIKKRQPLADTYAFAKSFLPSLMISQEAIGYYASLVEYYTVQQLQKISQETSFLYLLCYVHHRIQRINNDLIKSFIFHVNGYVKNGKEAKQERIIGLTEIINASLQKAGKVWNLFVDEKIPNHTTFGTVRRTAFDLVSREEFDQINEFLKKGSFDEQRILWEEYGKLAPSFKKNLRPILLSVDFSGVHEEQAMLETITFLCKELTAKRDLKDKRDVLPLEVIPKKSRSLLYDTGVDGKKSLNHDRFEFMVYLRLKESLEAGHIYCHDSIEFRSLDDDLIDLNTWNTKKNELLKNAGLSHLETGINLSNLKQKLDARYQEVNLRIVNGDNREMSIKEKRKGNRSWSLPYTKVHQSEDRDLFFKLHPQISLKEVIHFVNHQTDFMSSFCHISGKKSDKNSQAIVATLVALGTNLGTTKMAAISDMNLHKLRSALKNFLRLETLASANDIIANATAKLPAFKAYSADSEIHSSSDGQKFETDFPTMKSRYSPKYFGLNKGVTSYTMVANHVPINAKVIGANEHESHFVFDLIYNNTSEIKPDQHSTDSHGVNNVNFLLLNLFGFRFAPRYRNLPSKTDSLVGFGNLHHHKDSLIKPRIRVPESLIEEEQDNMLRILTSLALKHTTQSTLIRKLSSHKRKNKTKQALWAWDSIYESLYILDYIDNLKLRQNVQKALCRGESYHALRRAVSIANSRSMKPRSDAELEVWNECSRLLANTIIFYNTYILSHVAAGDFGKVARVAPTAWGHINFHGCYNFSEKADLNTAEIISMLQNQV